MVFKNILVPYDHSDPAKRALAKACAMAAEDADVKVTLLYIIKVPDFESSEFRMLAEASGGQMSKQHMDEVIKRFLDSEMKSVRTDIASTVEGYDVPVTVELMQGDSIVAAVCKGAEMHGCDLIIMGSRGLGALRAALGSVSYGVLRSSDVPVLIMK